MRKTTFVVGRAKRRSTLMVFISTTTCPIVGPWTMTAVVSTN